MVRVRTYLGQALPVAERRGKVARIAEMPPTRSLPTEQQSLMAE